MNYVYEFFAAVFMSVVIINGAYKYFYRETDFSVAGAAYILSKNKENFLKRVTILCLLFPYNV